MGSQSQEIAVRDLGMGDDGIRCEDFQNAKIFQPKMVTCCFTKLAQDRKNRRDISRAVWVVRMAGDADKATGDYR